MFCKNCGNKLDENSLRCNYCGKVVEQKTNPSTFEQSVQQPMYEQLVQQPVYEQPVQQPMYEQLVQQPIYEQPVQQPIQKKKRGLSKNKIIIIVISVLVLVGLFFGISFILKKDETTKKAINYFLNDDPILIKKDSLFGYINRQGSYVVEPKYKEALEFTNGYASVFLPKDEEGDSYFAIIDKKGKVVFSEKSLSIQNAEYFSEQKVWLIENRLFDKNFFPLTDSSLIVKSIDGGYFYFSTHEGDVGMVNSKGDVTHLKTNVKGFSVKIQLPDSVEIKDHYCITYINYEEKAIINCKTGKVVVDYSENNIRFNDDNVFEITIFDEEKDRDTYELLYIEDDKIVYRKEGYSGLNYYSAGYLRVYEDHSYKYFNIKTKELEKEKPILPKPDYKKVLKGFRALNCGSGLYGVLKDGNIVVPCKWYEVSVIKNPLANYLQSIGKEFAFVEDDKVHLLNIKTNKIIDTFDKGLSYQWHEPSDTIFLKYIGEESEDEIVYNVINKKKMIIDSSASIYLYTDYFIVWQDSQYKYYNSNLELIYTGERY